MKRHSPPLQSSYAMNAGVFVRQGEPILHDRCVVNARILILLGPAMILWTLLGTQRIAVHSLILVELFILALLAARELKPGKNGGRSLALGVIVMNYLVATLYGFFLDHALLCVTAIIACACPLMLLWYWRRYPRPLIPICWILVAATLGLPPVLTAVATNAGLAAVEASEQQAYETSASHLRTLNWINLLSGRSQTERTFTRFRLAEVLGRAGHFAEADGLLQQCDAEARRLPVPASPDPLSQRDSLPWLMLNLGIPALRSRIFEAKAWSRPIRPEESFLPLPRLNELDGLTWSTPLVQMAHPKTHP